MLIKDTVQGSAQATLRRLVENAGHIEKQDVQSILILYEDEVKMLGDCCVRFDKLKYFRAYMNNANITINFSNRKNQKYYDGLLTNNPHIDRVSDKAWEEIAFDSYDIIFLAALNERNFLDFLHENYGAGILSGEITPVVFSISELMQGQRVSHIFPLYEELLRYVQTPLPGELYISRQEQEWADAWLRRNGLQENEELFIFVDTSAIATKLLDMNLYFDFLKFCLSNRKARVLIFDEKNRGKEILYKKYLDEETFSKIIFSKGQTLRQDLCLIGSSYTSLVFGPCTGLMHCASGIFNCYVNKGLPADKIPAIIVYTGRIGNESYDLHSWWGNAPLVKCLLLLKTHDKKELVLLSSLPDSLKRNNNALPCTEYTLPLLVHFIQNKLNLFKNV